MKRILFMHHVSGVGGGSFCLLNVVKELDRTIWEPVVALKAHGPLEDEFAKLGITVVFFKGMTSVPYNKFLLKKDSIQSYYYSFNTRSDFKKLIEENHIDVVYINNMMLYPYLRPAKECGCKTVLHVREHWPLKEHRMQLNWARKSVYKYADKLIAINKFSASIFPDKKSDIIYDWIEMKDRFKPINMDSLFGEDCSNKVILLYNGGLQMIKGPNYIVKAFSEHIKGDNYRLLMIGVNGITPLSGFRHRVKIFLTKFGYRYSYKEMIDTINNDKRIKCIPAVYEMMDFYLKSSCFVSYFSMPHANLSLAESLFLKRPCITADNEEAREYSNNGEYALLVEPNNYKKFAKGLNSFLNSLGKWTECADKASYKVKEKFDRNLNVSRLRIVLESLV